MICSDFSRFMDAIRNNNISQLKELINAGFDVNNHGSSEIDTPLRLAVEEENVEAVQLLLEFGATPSGFLMLVLRDLIDKKHNYQTPKSILQIIQLLSFAGIELDFRLDTDKTLLMEAALNNALDVVEILIQEGSNVNLVGRRGHYALMCAVQTESKEVIDFLAPLTCDQLRKKAEQANSDES